VPDSFYVFVERKKKRGKKTKQKKNLGGIKVRTFIPSAIWTQFSRIIK